MEKLSKFQRIFFRLYYFLFVERFNKKIEFKFEKNTFRWDLIAYLHSKYNFKSYLEIGCDDDLLFSKISIKDKIGVDPNYGGNLRKTSDQFFKDNKNTFDCIFIDGLHYYSQVKKDIQNSLKVLNSNGIILLHDCLPNNHFEQAVPRCQITWNGDVWKAIVECRVQEEIDTYTCYADFGIGVIFKRKNRNILKLEKKRFLSNRIQRVFLQL